MLWTHTLNLFLSTYNMTVTILKDKKIVPVRSHVKANKRNWKENYLFSFCSPAKLQSHYVSCKCWMLCSWAHWRLLLGDRGMISITLPLLHWFLSSITDFEPTAPQQPSVLFSNIKASTNPHCWFCRAVSNQSGLLRTQSTSLVISHRASPTSFSVLPVCTSETSGL